MSIRQRGFVTIIALAIAVAFPACNPERGVTLKANEVPISLTAPNGACLQNGVEDGNVAVGKDGVVWSNPSALNVEVHFQAGCPFTKCDFGPSMTPISSGPPAAAVGNIYKYSSIKIDNKDCQVGGDGIVMR